MIKIIKRGTRDTITCEECGCVFSYEQEDVCVLTSIANDDTRTAKMVGKYIKCPQCDSGIDLTDRDRLDI